MEMIDQYAIKIQWSDEDEAYLASCMEFPSLMTHGESPEEAFKELRFILETVVEDMKATGQKIPTPLKDRKYKGNISLRLPSETHEELVNLAMEQDLSLNQFITTIIEKNQYASSFRKLYLEMQNMIDELKAEVLTLKTINEELVSSYMFQKTVAIRYFIDFSIGFWQSNTGSRRNLGIGNRKWKVLVTCNQTV
jgi:predicted RNase H-like HicB family nuclease/predicted DNA-binding protein